MHLRYRALYARATLAQVLIDYKNIFMKRAAAITGADARQPR